MKASVLFWLAVIFLFGGFIYLISPVLLPFVLGLGLAYMLDPLADRLEAHGLSRTKATTVISGGFFLFGTIALILLVPLAIEQLTTFFKNMPDYADAVRKSVNPYISQLSREFEMAEENSLKELATSIGQSSTEVLTSFLQGILQSGMAIVNLVGLLVITPVVSFYLLRDWDKMVAELDELLPRDYAPVIRDQLRQIDQTLAAFVRGQVNVMLVLAVFYAVTLSVAGLSYSLVVALVAGFAVIIPYVGTIFSGLLAVGLAYIQFDNMQDVGIIAAIFVFGQMLEGYVLTPGLVGKSVGLNPIWIIFGMMAGGALMGFVGILLAVPLTAVCGVLLRFAVAKYQQSRFYRGENTPPLVLSKTEK